jgi:hypothetical protein
VVSSLQVFRQKIYKFFISAAFLLSGPHLDPAMVQAVSLRPLTAEVQVRAQLNLCEICGGQISTEQAFLRVLRFSYVVISP